MQGKIIPDAVLNRLPRYYRYLRELLDEGTQRISSAELSSIMKVTASQVRQDLNNFGGFGQQGYGYNVEYLKNEIGRILGLDKQYQVIIIGGGNLARALAGYSKFRERGFNFSAIFDVDKSVVGTRVGDIEIMHMDELPHYMESHEVDIAALAIPKDQAHSIADDLYAMGVRAFWNFAHCDLDLPEDAISENVHLSDSLMHLTYKLNK